MLAIGLVAVARANRIAHQRLLASYEEQGRQLLLAGDPLRGIVYLEQAYREGADSPALHFLLGRATHALDVQVASLQHGDQVVDAHYSPDGKRVVTASLDKTAKLWESDKGKLIATLNGHTDAVHSARFSPDGRRIVTSSSDGTAKVWDAVRGQLLGALDAGPPIQAPTLADFSRDGEIIVTAVGPIAKVWDAQSLAQLATLSGHQKRIKMFIIDPKTNDILTYGQDGLLKRFSADGQQRFSVIAHEEDTYAQYLRPLALSSDGETIITGSSDATVNAWHAKTGTKLFSIQAGEGFVRSTAISPNGEEFLATTYESSARVWSMKTRSILRLLQGHAAAVWFASYSTDGAQLLTTSSDTTARLWTTSTAAPLLTLVGHTDIIVSAEFSPDQNRIITASFDRSAKIWDKTRGALLLDVYLGWATPAEHQSYVRLSSDGARLFLVNSVGRLEVRELSNWRLIDTLMLPDRCCATAAWSPNERQVAVVKDQTATVLEFPSGRTTFVATSPTPISALRYSPDGSLLAVGSADSCARLWDTASGTMRLELKNVCGTTLAFAFSSDSHYLLTGGDHRRLVLWNLATGAEIFASENFKGRIVSVAFSPDDTRFVTASRDRHVTIWDTHTGTPLVFLGGSTAPNVNTVAFNPDGTLVSTGDVFGSTEIWDSATGRLLSTYTRGLEVSGVEFSRDRSRLLVWDPERVMLWETAAEAGSIEQVSAYVRCRVPFRLDSGKLTDSPIPPECRR